MPAPEVLNLTDYAVLWIPSTTDDYGMKRISSPTEIRVRWEGSVEMSGGHQDTVQALPVTIYVDRYVPIGSIMWHGRVKDLPDPPVDLYWVVGHSTTPDIRGRVMQRTVTLARYNESLPEVVG